MIIDTFITRLTNKSKTSDKFAYTVGRRLLPSDIEDIEKKLNLKIPNKVKVFYLVANGLRTSDPALDIIDMNSWIVRSSLIHFATFDDTAEIYFDISELNPASEWTIVNKEAGYKLTLSMASFWSNKIWHWIDKERRIWEPNWETKLSG